MLYALTLLPQLGDIPSRTIYLACAAGGGLVLSIQLLLLFLGGDVADGEVDADHGGDGLSFFSIRAVASFMTFFGLLGLYGMEAGWSAGVTAASAAGAGVGMMIVVAWLFSLQSRLHQDGNLDPSSAVGASAVVYLRVPAAGEGKGKVTVHIQGRTAEFAAVTDGPEIPTGADVRIVSQVNDTTFVVERA